MGCKGVYITGTCFRDVYPLKTRLNTATEHGETTYRIKYLLQTYIYQELHKLLCLRLVAQVNWALKVHDVHRQDMSIYKVLPLNYLVCRCTYASMEIGESVKHKQRDSEYKQRDEQRDSKHKQRYSECKQRESEECFPRECDACATDDLIREAKFFCPKCKEQLCSSCQTWHSKLKATRSHAVLPVAGVSQHTFTDQSIQPDSVRIACECGGESDMLYFCKTHETVICSSCKRIEHKRCKTSTLGHLSKTQIFSELFDEITSKTNELIEKGQQVHANIERKQNELDGSEGLFKQEIKNFRITLNNLLDSLEETSLEDFQYRSEQAYAILKEHKQTVANSLQCLNEINKLFKNLLTDSHNKSKMCILKHKLQNVFQKCHQEIQTTSDKVSNFKILFTQNKDLTKLHQRLDSLGNIDISVPLKDDVVRNAFLRAQPETISTVNVKQPDKIRPRITAIAFTYTGDLLAADSRNGQLLLLNAKTMKIQATCSYPKPFFYLHLAALKDHSCLSIVPGEKELQFIKTKSRFKLGESKPLNDVCHAMTATNQSIFLVCSEEIKSPLHDHSKSSLDDQPKSPLSVIVMDHNGIITETIQSVDIEIKLEPTAYCNMAASLDSQMLFIAQNLPAVRSSVICIAVSGKRVYNFTDPDMRRVRGLVPETENNILVCCETPNSVFVLTSDGRKQKVMLTPDNGLINPNTMAFRLSDGVLVIGDDGETGIGDRISMFKIY